MTAAHDKKFFDTFTLVLGALVAIAVLIYILARIVAANTQDKTLQDYPRVKAAIAERIAPVAKVAIAGRDNTALEPPKQAAAPAQDMSGEDVYNSTCVACHGAGVAGAPKFGDAAAWTPRLAKGAATLHKHAIEGFQGEAGFMPPKGGRADLTDKSIIDAVEYMTAAAKK